MSPDGTKISRARCLFCFFLKKSKRERKRKRKKDACSKLRHEQVTKTLELTNLSRSFLEFADCERSGWMDRWRCCVGVARDDLINALK
jgi:hypothetical protein